MAINYLQKRAVAYRMIKRWGTRAVLRSNTGDRPCYALQVSLSAAERRALRADADSVFLVSPTDIGDTKPDHNKEALVILAGDDSDLERYRIVVPASPLNPGGVVIYWELETRGNTRAA